MGVVYPALLGGNWNDGANSGSRASAARQSRWEPASIRMRLRCRCC